MGFINLPDQTIPEIEKTEQWHKDHVIDYVSHSISHTYDDQRDEILKYFRAYNAELTDKEKELLKNVTCPHGIDLGVEYVVYPLIQMKVEQIVGEWMKRPLKRKAYALDKKSRNKKFEQKLKLLSEEIMRDITKKLEKDLGFKAKTENPEMELPNDIEEFFSKDFKTLAEDTADGIINIFLDARKEKSKLRQTFLKYCIADRAHIFLEKKDGYTSARDVHPLDVDHDITPYKVVQDDHEHWFENYWLSENEIYNSFPELTKAQKAEVKKLFDNFETTDVSSYQSKELNIAQKYNGWIEAGNKGPRMRLVYAMWKSRKKVPIVKKESKHGDLYKKVKEDDIRNNDKVEYITGEMPRHVIMLGPDLCLSWGLMEHRYTTISNPFKCKLPGISIIRDNPSGSSLIKSVAAKLYQLQQIASEVLFEIRLSIKNMGDSRVLVYDAAQTPKEFTKAGYEQGLNRVMHHIKKDKLMVINSKQKGFNATFNQFTSLDLSQKGAVQDLFNGLAIIEDLASKFVGIAPEREGQVGQYQTATGTDKALRGSFARTEIIATPFDDFVQVLLERVVLHAKYDYKKGELLEYIIGDFKTKFLKLVEEFYLADFGIYLADASKDQAAAERIDRAAELALGNAQQPDMVMGLIEVFEGETASEKKAVFQRMLNAMDKLREENMKIAQEQQQQALAAQADKEEKDRNLTREGHDKDRDVAHIYTDGKAKEIAAKNNSQEKIKAAELATQQEQNRKNNQEK